MRSASADNWSNVARGVPFKRGLGPASPQE